MNEQTHTTEPLAAIIAEIKRENRPYGISLERLHYYADRLEAAAKRERDQFRDATKKPGNAAALREALDKAECVLLVSSRFATDNVFADSEARENLRDADWDGALAEIDAALTAPARNCDRFAKPDDAMRAFAAATGTTTIDLDAALSFAAWLFAPERNSHA